MRKLEDPSIFIGDTVQQRPEQEVHGEFVRMHGDDYYRIRNYDAMPPFFMSIVSSSDHWLFISSTGGLSAGRVNSEQALFPYYTEDKLTENYESTGGKTILLVTRGGRISLWEPFSERQHGMYRIQRNIYKNVSGTVLLFEEINHSLGCNCRYAWRTSDTYGFIKTTWLSNFGDSSCLVELVDGVQNILPANITSQTQNTFSPLLDAYKRSELDLGTGLAIFALNSTLTDLAEPSESLLGTTIFQLGLEPLDYLLSSQQLDRFRTEERLVSEVEVRGRRCAYFVHSVLELAPGEERLWHLVAEVNQDSAAIVDLSQKLRAERSNLQNDLEQDIARNHLNLEKLVARADGLQVTEDRLCTAHHFANVMFNVMRGGVFADQYRVQVQDFIDFVTVRNPPVLTENAAFFSGLPPQLNIFELQARAEASGNPDLIRLCYGYLPLSFSRRHGDPSRPWNQFSIEIKKPDGSPKLGYEGNWRDIFQNWEALAWSYPEYVESMIFTFLNATTADGYNPYRVTGDGIDWEVPEPDNPWANIGYWSDHQLIYLLKLMEISSRVHPGRLQRFLSRPVFSHANVPYRIKEYTDLLKDPFNTIAFDWELEREIDARVQNLGTDGKLMLTRDGRVLHTTLLEKLLILLLAKLANFVPEGGIWMNTQRPEWNDANNALVGKGLSVVTLCYMRRILQFCRELLQSSDVGSLSLSEEVGGFYLQVSRILSQFQTGLRSSFSDSQRRLLMDALGQAGSDYRWNTYTRGFSGGFVDIPVLELAALLDLAQQFVEHSLRANKREDNLYHAYNVLHLGDGTASIARLDEMLEGQVAVLSSGMLSGHESLELLKSLRHGRLYRSDQHSFILYPDRELKGFLEKNCITPEQVSGIKLLSELVRGQDKSLIVRDGTGSYHFSGNIRNVKDVTRILEALKVQPRFAGYVEAESEKVRALFENIFHHNEFTGRSGTFFAYEGLGSIYWHMVSKLLLAVQETIFRTRSEPSLGALMERYADIRKGLSFNKSPAVYGSFPTDPYSHTPKGQGARQPGMTGMVKEEILTRQGELGFTVRSGQVAFDFLLLDRNEFLSGPSKLAWWNIHDDLEQVDLDAGSIAFTICQVPIIIHPSKKKYMEVHRSDGGTEKIDGHVLDPENSRHILQRDGAIHHLVVFVD
jgi:hypothetical protein